MTYHEELARAVSEHFGTDAAALNAVQAVLDAIAATGCEVVRRAPQTEDWPVPRHLLTKLMAVMRECGWNNSAAANHETDNEMILALAAQEVHDEFSVLIGE